MAHLSHRCRDYFPQRQATLMQWVNKCWVQLTLEALPSETGPNSATTVEEPSLPAEHLCRTGYCETEKESDPSNKTSVASPSAAGRQRQPAKDVTALLKRLRIPPEAQRILGNSVIPVVSLERLNFRSMCSVSSLQPVVSLVRLPCITQDEICSDASRPRQNGFSHNEANITDLPDLRPGSTPTSWTEPYCPDSSSPEEPEQDSGFDCDSNPDQPYILFPGSDEWDPDEKNGSETFYLDPDPEQTMVIELDSEAEAEQGLVLEDEPEVECEVDSVQMDDGEDLGSSSTQQAEPGQETQDLDSEDFCAVCLNGGDLLCCDCCPKVYHLACHVPPLTGFPLGDWVCTLCRTDQEPVHAYSSENFHSCGRVQAPYTLSNQDQRRCEKLTLLLYCHTLSAPFHEAVSPLARNYYQIIKRPIDLSVICKKLDKSNTLHYFTAQQFVDDVLLMFKNCATFNYPDSEVAQAGRNLEVFFLSKLKEVFPEQTFPLASQDTMDTARQRWLGRKRKENYRKKKHVFSGKKYYL